MLKDKSDLLLKELLMLMLFVLNPDKEVIASKQTFVI